MNSRPDRISSERFTIPLTEDQAIAPFWQRMLDLAIAGSALILFSPLLTMVALAVRAGLGRPVLFRQVRPGLLGREFTILKFRTMRAAVYSSGEASPDAARITRLGAFLRRTSLDELPELWTILRGDMSLVGPRPLLTEYLPYYTQPELRRFLVRPGLTGLAQISGRNSLEWDKRLALDVKFVDQLSPRLYLSILFRTISKVLTSDGVAEDSYSVIRPLHIERAARPRHAE